MHKIGFSRDKHRLNTGKRLTLGGIEIDSPYETVAHSDGDVLLHAISEALLGALALGDLGTHFPDSQKETKDMDSKKILANVYDMIKNKGYTLSNLDAMVHLEKPKLAAHIMPMCKTVAHILDVPVENVSIKATTGEAVDAVGRCEAIEAEAIVLLQQPATIRKL